MQNYELNLLQEFEDHFTDILNCLESHELEFQLMKEFSEFHQGLVQADFTNLR